MKSSPIEERIYSFACKERFEEAINLLKKITDSELRIQVCYNVLIGFAISIAIKEYGGVVVLEDKDKYERAKIGLEDLPPYAILYKDTDDNIQGLEDMLDFVPEYHPIKQYYFKISN